MGAWAPQPADAAVAPVGYGRFAFPDAKTPANATNKWNVVFRRADAPAGVYDFRPLADITPEHFHKQFDLNVLGLLLTTQEAVKLIGAEGGSIINISSIVGPMPVPSASVYSATKAAVDAITVALAGELGPRKIRVNSINPGMVETEGLHSVGFAESDFRKHVEATTPLGRIAQPSDIATAAVFFASDDAGWITGQTLVLAGGARQ